MIAVSRFAAGDEVVERGGKGRVGQVMLTDKGHFVAGYFCLVNFGSSVVRSPDREIVSRDSAWFHERELRAAVEVVSV